MPDEKQIERVKAVLMQYCNPKKEYDGVAPREIVLKIIEAVKGDKSWDAV